MKDQRDHTEHVCNIIFKVMQKVKYLGIDIDNKRNYIKTQRYMTFDGTIVDWTSTGGSHRR